MSETEGAPKKYEVSVQAMDEQCTKASDDYGDISPLGDMDAGLIVELLGRFHRLPYPRPGLPEDHCPPQVLVSHGDEWLAFVLDGGRILETQTETYVSPEEGAALVERHFAAVKPQLRKGLWRLFDFFRS